MLSIDLSTVEYDSHAVVALRGDLDVADAAGVASALAAVVLLAATQREQQAAAQLKDLAAEKGSPVAQQLGQAGQEAAQELRESG